MRELIKHEMFEVSGGTDYVVEEEFPSLIDDFLFFVAIGAATSGFGVYLVTSIFSQSIPLQIATTIGGVFFGIGACILIEAVLP